MTQVKSGSGLPYPCSGSGYCTTVTRGAGIAQWLERRVRVLAGAAGEGRLFDCIWALSLFTVKKNDAEHGCHKTSVSLIPPKCKSLSVFLLLLFVQCLFCCYWFFVCFHRHTHTNGGGGGGERETERERSTSGFNWEKLRLLCVLCRPEDVDLISVSGVPHCVCVCVARACVRTCVRVCVCVRACLPVCLPLSVSRLASVCVFQGARIGASQNSNSPSLCSFCINGA